MMPIVKLEPVTAEAFAPFGSCCRRAKPASRRFELIEELQNLRATAKPRLSLAAVARRSRCR